LLQAQLTLMTNLQSTVDENANRARTSALENPLDQQAVSLLAIGAHLASGSKEASDNLKELLKIALRVKKRSAETGDSLRRESSDLARAVKAKFPDLGETLLEALHITRAQEEKVYDRFNEGSTTPRPERPAAPRTARKVRHAGVECRTGYCTAGANRQCPSWVPARPLQVGFVRGRERSPRRTRSRDRRRRRRR
jgi:hypothetical protein